MDPICSASPEFVSVLHMSGVGGVPDHMQNAMCEDESMLLPDRCRGFKSPPFRVRAAMTSVRHSYVCKTHTPARLRSTPAQRGVLRRQGNFRVSPPHASALARTLAGGFSVRHMKAPNVGGVCERTAVVSAGGINRPCRSLPQTELPPPPHCDCSILEPRSLAPCSLGCDPFRPRDL